MRACERCESRKNICDGIRLNPKCRKNRKSAAKFRIGKGSTTRDDECNPVGPQANNGGSKWHAPKIGEDIVYAHMKI